MYLLRAAAPSARVTRQRMDAMAAAVLGSWFGVRDPAPDRYTYTLNDYFSRFLSFGCLDWIRLYGDGDGDADAM